MLGNGTTIQLVFLWRRQDCSSLHDHCIAGHPNKLRVGRFCSAQASGHPSHLPRSGQPSPGNRRGGESICRLCITVLTLHCRSLATPLNVTYRDISRQACLCSRHRSPGETTSEAQWRSALWSMWAHDSKPGSSTRCRRIQTSCQSVESPIARASISMQGKIPPNILRTALGRSENAARIYRWVVLIQEARRAPTPGSSAS